MIWTVIISKRAEKQLKKMPMHIVDKLDTWIDAVERDGLEVVRRIPGYHDEPLKGDRQGERSIRLSRSYRAIYEMRSNSRVEFASVEEVSRHEY